MSRAVCSFRALLIISAGILLVLQPAAFAQTEPPHNAPGQSPQPAPPSPQGAPPPPAAAYQVESGGSVQSFSDETPDMEGLIDPANLEKYPLSDLILQAIVTKSDPQYNIAMLEAGGIGYSVQIGSKIGADSGMVREITDTGVVIDLLDAEGKPSGKTMTLSLSN